MDVPNKNPKGREKYQGGEGTKSARQSLWVRSTLTSILAANHESKNKTSNYHNKKKNKKKAGDNQKKG